jgi:hypothetical protein
MFLTVRDAMAAGCHFVRVISNTTDAAGFTFPLNFLVYIDPGITWTITAALDASGCFGAILGQGFGSGSLVRIATPFTNNASTRLFFSKVAIEKTGGAVILSVEGTAQFTECRFVCSNTTGYLTDMGIGSVGVIKIFNCELVGGGMACSNVISTVNQVVIDGLIHSGTFDTVVDKPSIVINSNNSSVTNISGVSTTFSIYVGYATGASSGTVTSSTFSNISCFVFNVSRSAAGFFPTPTVTTCIFSNIRTVDFVCSNGAGTTSVIHSEFSNVICTGALNIGLGASSTLQWCSFTDIKVNSNTAFLIQAMTNCTFNGLSMETMVNLTNRIQTVEECTFNNILLTTTSGVGGRLDIIDTATINGIYKCIFSNINAPEYELHIDAGFFLRNTVFNNIVVDSMYLNYGIGTQNQNVFSNISLVNPGKTSILAGQSQRNRFSNFTVMGNLSIAPTTALSLATSLCSFSNISVDGVLSLGNAIRGVADSIFNCVSANSYVDTDKCNCNIISNSQFGTVPCIVLSQFSIFSGNIWNRRVSDTVVTNGNSYIGCILKAPGSGTDNFIGVAASGTNDPLVVGCRFMQVDQIHINSIGNTTEL